MPARSQKPAGLQHALDRQASAGQERRFTRPLRGCAVRRAERGADQEAASSLLRARVRAALRAAADRPAAPFVRAALRAAAERSLAVRREAARVVCRDRAERDAVLLGSFLSACVTARDMRGRLRVVRLP
jgi:hypothetical protein